jgi:very-short-patch-repair endonuclease
MGGAVKEVVIKKIRIFNSYMDKRKFINESKHNRGADLSIRRKAKDLRKSMTKAEKILWERLKMGRMKGKHFRRQHAYAMYILDFYCFESNLVIELDGEIHQFREDYDTERTEFLESTGLKVIRFANDDVIERIDSVLEEIAKQL